jgi:hypothetical protein
VTTLSAGVLEAVNEGRRHVVMGALYQPAARSCRTGARAARRSRHLPKPSSGPVSRVIAGTQLQ